MQNYAKMTFSSAKIVTNLSVKQLMNLCGFSITLFRFVLFLLGILFGPTQKQGSFGTLISLIDSVAGREWV